MYLNPFFNVAKIGNKAVVKKKCPINRAFSILKKAKY